MSSNSPDTIKQELEARLAHLERENEQLRRAKRRVGLSFQRVPETGSQIEALTNGQFPYFEHVSSCSYALADRHVDENAKGSPLSEAMDGNITLIEGDNLPVLAALQQTHRGRVDVIYIDPPYNTGNNDFIYNDARMSSVADIEGASIDDYARNLDGKARTVGKDDPERHSLWLSFMERRLFLAKELLSDTGVIFVSIDDNEQARLKVLMDEIFGEQNFEGNIHWRRRKTQPNDNKLLARVTDQILVFSKKHDKFVSAKAFVGLPIDEKGKSRYSNPDNDPRGEWTTRMWTAAKGQGGSTYSIELPSGEVIDTVWLGNKETYERLLKDNRIVFNTPSSKPRKKIFLSERGNGKTPTDWWDADDFGTTSLGTSEVKTILGGEKFSYPKPTLLIKQIVRLIANKNAIVLDFFAGSGTTGHAVAELNKEDGGNRQCILVTHGDEDGKNIAKDVTAERLKRVLSGENWTDGKFHVPLPGELNYYKLEFSPRQNDPETAVQNFQNKFVGYAALQQDAIAVPTQPNPEAFIVMKNSKKTVVMVTDENYLWDESEKFSGTLEVLKKEADNIEIDPVELIIYVPTSDDFDGFGFGDMGWKVVQFPIEFLKSHEKLIGKMKANGTLIPSKNSEGEIIKNSEYDDSADNIEGNKSENGEDN